MSTLKNTAVLSAAIATLLATNTAQAEFQVSGQVNRMVMMVDNGFKDGIVHADNSVSGTRIRIKSKNDIGNGMSAGIYWEKQFQQNRSNDFNEGNLDNENLGLKEDNRQGNLWIKGGFGRIQLGQGDGAANGSAQADKSGTSVIQYSGSNTDILDSMEYGVVGGGGAVTVGDARSDFDGLSRNSNLRYDGGNGPINFALSFSNGDSVEGSFKYKTSNLEVRVGIWDEGDHRAKGRSGQAISASWVAGKEGLTLTGSFSGDDRANDPTNTYLKVGYKTGDNSFGLDYSVTSDLVANNVDAESTSVAWVKKLDKGVQVYASYRVESLDVAGTDDITALIGGARVKF